MTLVERDEESAGATLETAAIGGLEASQGRVEQLVKGEVPEVES